MEVFKIEDTLNHIKEMHEKANNLYMSGKEDEAIEIIKFLFENSYTDWLIDMAESLNELQKESKL